MEICQDQAWFTLSAADGWGTEEAEVVCRQLGMSGQGLYTLPNESTKVQSLGAIVNKQTPDSCACSRIIQYALSQC